jgi:hypothetical protein
LTFQPWLVIIKPKTVEEIPMDAYKALEERKLPDILTTKRGKKVKNPRDYEKRREELKRIVCENIYGNLPPKPDHFRVETRSEKLHFAGKAYLRECEAICTYGDKEFSFPFKEAIPIKAEKSPVFIHISFRSEMSHHYRPAEEIIDRGYAIISFCYKDVATDDNDFKGGIARYLSSGRRALSSPGKIAMWAWAAMRLMDYVIGKKELDGDNVAVIGHSRLGKTALLAGAMDERFKYVISNDSGCSGAAITRGKIGESRNGIRDVFPYWFCPRYLNCTEPDEALDFDQHFLLALTAPRHLLIGSAKEDSWADPTSEFLSLLSVNPVYRLYGLDGVVTDGVIPEAKTVLDKGNALYQLRHGTHFLSREDWNEYMNYIDKFIK